MPDEIELAAAQSTRVTVLECVAAFYCAIDDRNWDGLEHLLVADYATNHPVAGVMAGRDIFIAAGKALGVRLTATQHLGTDHRVEIAGASATVTCNCFAVHMFQGEDGAVEFANAGNLHSHTLRHEGERWRIVSTSTVPRWTAPRYHGLLRGELFVGDGR